MQSWTQGVTRSAMYAYLNAWLPSRRINERPATDRVTSVDWIEYSGASAPAPARRVSEAA